MRAGLYRKPSPATRRWPTGLVGPSDRSGFAAVLGSYPITPASGHPSRAGEHKRFGVRTFHAETRSAASVRRLGAALGGSLGGHDHERPLGVRTQVGGPSDLPSRSRCPLIIVTSSGADRPRVCDQRRAVGPAAGMFGGRRGRRCDHFARSRRRTLLRRGNRSGADRDEE